ncbi:MAG: hypothetical protein ACERKD_03635 [Prolixibacteraceae bacterium]
MKNIFFFNNRNEYVINGERQLWSLPLYYFPYSSLKIEIKNWPDELNNQIAKFIEPEFTACGCSLGKLFLKIALLASTIFGIYIHFSIDQHMLRLALILFVFCICAAILGKLIALYYNRFLLLKKLKYLKNENNRNNLTVQTIKNCGCH